MKRASGEFEVQQKEKDHVDTQIHRDIFEGISNVKKARIPFFGIQYTDMFSNRKSGWPLIYDCILGVPQHQFNENIVNKHDD